VISFDTNLLLASLEENHAAHVEARGFVHSLNEREDVAVSELVLVELYVLLRNPKVVPRPLSATRAASVCQLFRRHPRWQLLGFPAESSRLHNALWELAGSVQFARRRIYDLRLALALVEQGVTEFATLNVKDFADLGFAKVWNPLLKL
jgi:toxin-antitoxin system PIN domain toxin